MKFREKTNSIITDINLFKTSLYRKCFQNIIKHWIFDANIIIIY